LIVSISCIYAIINIINDKHYVGQTIDKSKRFKEHLKCLKGNYHCNKYLQRSWSIYGNDNFIFVVLEKCPQSELNEREQHWIDILKPDYNLAPVAGSMLNYKHTEEAKVNMSKAHKGKEQSIETKRKRSISMIGNKNSVGVDKSIQIEAMRIATKGKPKSEEHKQKIAAPQKGRVFTEDHKIKLSEAAKRRWKSIDRNLKINSSSGNPSLSG
jgi:group I intron endonuclease